MQEDIEKAAAFLAAAIRGLGGFDEPAHTRVMDFGCGTGQLVHALCRLGFDTYGCDIPKAWTGLPPSVSNRLRVICLDPYRLPFDENTFDAVVSTSVLEHAQNKAECFREIHRVLRPGGYAMHLYPGKWYLPYEPHIYVPLANHLWPRCPQWWLGVWAFLGVRNEYQQGQPWRTVVAANHRYCQDELSYWTTQQYRDLSLKVFGNCRWPMRFYVENAPGGFACLFKRLPFRAFSGALCRETRMGFMIQQKLAEPARAADVLPERRAGG